jgi:hypothetical protein
MSDVSQQLEILGLDETLRRAASEGRTASVRSRFTNRIETVHDLLSAVPTMGDLSFPAGREPSVLEAAIWTIHLGCRPRRHIGREAKQEGDALRKQ